MFVSWMFAEKCWKWNPRIICFCFHVNQPPSGLMLLLSCPGCFWWCKQQLLQTHCVSNESVMRIECWVEEFLVPNEIPDVFVLRMFLLLFYWCTIWNSRVACCWDAEDESGRNVSSFLMFHFLLRRRDHVPDSSRRNDGSVAIDTSAVKPVVGSHVVSGFLRLQTGSISLSEDFAVGDTRFTLVIF